MTATHSISVEEARAVIAANSPDVLEAAERAEILAKYPAFQGFSNPLPPPDNAYDPSPAEQQRWYDAFVKANVGSERLERHGLDDRAYFTSQAANALQEWRRAEASKAWAASLRQLTAKPACAVCGAPSGSSLITIGARTASVCGRCRPSVTAAIALKVASEKLPNGRRREDVAGELVAKLLGG